MDDRQRFQEDMRILREQVFNLANTVQKLVESFEHMSVQMRNLELDMEDHRNHHDLLEGYDP